MKMCEPLSFLYTGNYYFYNYCQCNIILYFLWEQITLYSESLHTKELQDRRTMFT